MPSFKCQKVMFLCLCVALPVDTEDVCIVERLFSSSLVAIVSLKAPRKLKVCHFKKGTEICNYSYSNTILAVKLNRQRLIVCLEESLYIHNIRDMKVLHTIRETPPNPSGSHSLEFLSTGRVQPGSGPHFEQVTEFDGVVISHCDSGTQQEHFKPVLESHNLPGTCEVALNDAFGALKEISKFINHTQNVQRRRGCITSDERLESAFDNWAVNGEGFIQFDAGAQKWKALSPSAEMIKELWNGYEAQNYLFGQFIKEQCPEMIHQIKLREIEKRTDLRVFANPVNRTKALLKCHVTSTDKSVRSVSLTEDGATKANWITVTGPLPSGDGSVILILTAEVPLIHTNIYGCVVQTEDRNITVMCGVRTLHLHTAA
ncbi:WD repeat domain phosphoinositide-interacting protein 2 [Takifugu flavidus]|uniref:WD repeat domain phosphoinositide-interacting protein 2 n=1 Tax=Takifugu flavidus TaxID=433684 RepID=A0A5C6MIG5_9TELE|nr:WD repeat domain phosphoinositide-interacting protein 2 [Takifugu flavidus]